MITPSLPVFSITLAIKLPISSSCAERVATCAICALPSTGVDSFVIDFLTDSKPSSNPFLIAIGSAPAATFLNPSPTIACERTVDVVVPSPASSFVFLDASLIS